MASSTSLDCTTVRPGHYVDGWERLVLSVYKNFQSTDDV